MLSFRKVALNAHFYLNPRLRYTPSSWTSLEPRPQDFDQFNHVFKAWDVSWRSTLNSLGSDSSRLADEFFRFDFICGIYDDFDRLVAFMGSTSFDIRYDSDREQSYIKKLPTEFLLGPRGLSHPKLASLEFAYVVPEWRKHYLGVSLVDVLICLCGKEQFMRGTQQLIAFTRNDRSVNKTVYGRGGRAISQNEILHNVKIDSISILQQDFVFDPSSEIDSRIEMIWDNRIYRGFQKITSTLSEGENLWRA